MKYLWSLAFGDDRVEVCSSAMQQLAKFEWTSHSLKVMPEYCKQGLKLPPGVEPKQDDGTDLKPEDVLEYVPGEVWIELLEGTNQVWPPTPFLAVSFFVKFIGFARRANQ